MGISKESANESHFFVKYVLLFAYIVEHAGFLLPFNIL